MIPIARSKGGVKAVAHPFDNLIRTGIATWPPPEIVIFRATLWSSLCALPSHPLAGELARHVEWKQANSRMPKTGRRSGVTPS